MKTAILSAAMIFAATDAHAVVLALGGHFNPGDKTGYVDRVGTTLYPDQTGLVLGNGVAFSAPEIWPWPETVTVFTPLYGLVSMAMTTEVYQVINSAGDFWEMTGHFIGAESGNVLMSVNLVNPGYGTASFGILGSFAYSPPYVPPPPQVNPPPCVDCGPPPPCVDCNPPPPCLDCNPPPPAVPESSTWALMLIGLAGLWLFGRRRIA